MVLATLCLNTSYVMAQYNEYTLYCIKGRVTRSFKVLARN